jgi:hypothetical protein
MNCKHGMNPDWCAACKSPLAPRPRRQPHNQLNSAPVALIDFLLTIKVAVGLGCHDLRSQEYMLKELRDMGISSTPKFHTMSGGTSWQLYFHRRHAESVQTLCGCTKVSHHNPYRSSISCKDAVIQYLKRKEQQ